MRGGSKGVPGKNQKLLLGKPLMTYTIDCANGAVQIDDIVVSSDSDGILEIASAFIDSEKLYKRNASLATDNASKWDVFRDLVLAYEKKEVVNVEYLVDLDVTVPRRLPKHIDACIDLIKNDQNVDVVITGYEPERNPYFNMMEIQDDGTAVIVKKTEKPIVCRQDAPQVYSLTPAVYVIKREALFAFDHWSNARCKIQPIPRNFAIDIDTQMDFNLVEFFMTYEDK